MLEFSKIDKELEVYKNCNVLIFGASKAGLKIKHFFDRNGIKTIAFVDNDADKVGCQIEGINIFSVDQCIEYYNTHTDTIIQIGSTYEKDIVRQLRERGMNSFIWYSEFKDRLASLNRYRFYEKNTKLKAYFGELEWKRLCLNESEKLIDQLVNGDMENINMMLSAPKVGSTTVIDSIERRGISMWAVGHSYAYMNDFLQHLVHEYPVKEIIGVCDPIKQNLSLLFDNTHGEWILPYYDLEEYWNRGGDVESIFYKYLISDMTDKNCCIAEINRRIKTNWLVQDFFEQQIQPFFGVDLYQYPFDKQKGFSVYHINEKLDIFVYQLEKLNGLSKEIGDFLGISDLELIRGNDSGNKWYKESYLNVEKSMPIYKEYYDRCYSGKYIKHFYNDEDIKEFKNRWARN
ncbi:MAG TPA: hypothetical protein DDY31_18920, partial [Lachnospiraceae bacterium]|nr:hypothetical protein [Lachnospiraceae bacterium]